MHAASIRVLPGVPPPPPPAGSQAMSATGVVTAVTGTSVTVKLKTGESTFTINEKTKVIGTGMGTKAQEMKQAGEKPSITTFVATGDTVAVRYTEAGGAKTASEVRVTMKGPSRFPALSGSQVLGFSGSQVLGFEVVRFANPRTENREPENPTNLETLRMRT